jgi:hypothetical protein
MNQLTLRQIPDDLNKALRLVAKSKNSSLNKVIITLLKKILGLDLGLRKKRDLSKLAGTWNQKQVSEFTSNTRIFEKIDEELWQK